MLGGKFSAYASHAVAATLILGLPCVSHAAVLLYGDEDVLNTGTYPSDPTAGATLEGLAPGDVTLATLIEPHSYPFTPDVSDYPGTDQIYVGSMPTASHDGYSINNPTLGPDNISLDYSSLVAGQPIATLTLGIAFDDFQFPAYGQPFILSVNGVPDAALSALANSFDESGPLVQFATIGIDAALLSPTNVLSLSIDEGGDGGDGFAVDYLTVGVTTVPEPMSMGVMALAATGTLLRRRRR